MYIRAERLVLVAVRIAVLAFVLVSVGSLSSAGAATVVAQPGISVFKYPNNTWSASSLPRYATEVVTTPSLIAGVKSASPQTKVLNYKESMALADNCGTSVDTCQTAITYQQAQTHDAANPGDPWILQDASGKPIPNRSFAHVWLANVGPPPTSSSG